MVIPNPQAASRIFPIFNILSKKSFPIKIPSPLNSFSQGSQRTKGNG